ncbi:hypothetical protein HMPREF1986_01799 [Oribacterium sp. oral taxon 078 str. F0263]|nr:hypothetical protein HMPREF1986_01799 [Oribacterium sp. oral taxon 078 str. F0263]
MDRRNGRGRQSFVFRRNAGDEERPEAEFHIERSDAGPSGSRAFLFCQSEK